MITKSELTPSPLLKYAEEVGDTIDDLFLRSRVYHLVGAELAKAGSDERALSVLKRSADTAKDVSPPFLKASALADVADEYAALHKVDLSVEMCRNAIDTTVAFTQLPMKAIIFGRIAAIYFLLKRKNVAMELLFQMLRTISVEESTARKEMALKVIAMAYATIHAVGCAAYVTARISDHMCRTETAAMVAAKLAEMGKLDEYQQFSNVIISSEHLSSKVLAIIADADLQANVLNNVMALSIQAEELAKAELSGFELVCTFCQLARTYGKRGMQAKAFGMVSESVHIARDIKPEELMTTALYEICVTYAEIGSYEQSIAVAEKIDNLGRRNRAKTDIIRKLNRAGDIGRALELMREIEDDSLRSVALAETLIRCAQVGNIDRTTGALITDILKNREMS